MLWSYLYCYQLHKEIRDSTFAVCSVWIRTFCHVWDRGKRRCWVVGKVWRWSRPIYLCLRKKGKVLIPTKEWSLTKLWNTFIYVTTTNRNSISLKYEILEPQWRRQEWGIPPRQFLFTHFLQSAAVQGTPFKGAIHRHYVLPSICLPPHFRHPDIVTVWL